MQTEMMCVGNAASNLYTQYAREWQQAKRENRRCHWAIKAIKSCDELKESSKKRLVKELKARIAGNKSNMALISECLKAFRPVCAMYGPGAQWHEQYEKEQAELKKLDHVWDKFERKDVKLDIPDGMVEIIIPGTNIHGWLSYEQYKAYADKYLIAVKHVDHEAELKAFAEQKRLEREKQIEEAKKEVNDFFLKIFKELPKSERRKLDSTEEMMLIMDEVNSRYMRAKEEDESHLQVFYRHDLKGDEKGKEQAMNYARFAVSTNDKVKKMKAEAIELETIKKRTAEVGTKMCDECYRKGQDHAFCKRCKKAMAEVLKKLEEQAEFEILRERKGGDPDAQYEYIRERILGVYLMKERKFVPSDKGKARWFLKGYSEAKQEVIINFIIGQVMLMPDVFVSWDIDDCIIKVKSWLCTCKQYYLAGGYCGLTDRFEIIERWFDEQIGIQSKSITSGWVLVDENALDDMNCDNLRKVELPNGKVQYYQMILKPKFDFVDTTKMVFDLEHQDEASEADAIEEIADEYADMLLERNLYMEGLARAYAMYGHSYYEIVSSLDGVGKYAPKYASYLLQNFFTQVVERGIKDADGLKDGLKKRCRAERLNLKAAVHLYGIISVWAHAHKLGLV